MAKSRRTRKRNDHKAAVGEEPGPDISLLSRPTATSVKGIRDVLKAFEDGTPEVHHLLSNECEIVYECRVCRSLYRSFLNFITHKRIYCQQQYTSGSPKVSHFFNDVLDEDETVVVHNEPVRLTRQSVGEAASHKDVENTASTSSSKPKQLPRKNLTEILGLLSQKASASDGLQRLVGSDGFSALNSLMTDAGSDGTAPGFKGRIPRQHLLQLESLESTDVAIRQTVTLGPDGKILPNDVATAARGENETSPGSNDLAALETKLVCTKCDSQFSNMKTYKHHVTFVHDPARFFYLCPCCKSKFSNSWSVHRHLKSVHNKTTEQMRRLREQIQRVHKWEPAHDKPSKAALKPSPSNEEDLEQEKLYNERQSEMEVFEKEYNKCSGCNRSFDRLAAFNYHVRNCSRRIMALNTNLKVKKTALPRKEMLVGKPNESLAGSKPRPVESPSESSAHSNDEPVDLKPRQRQNSEKRLEPAMTKKIEIQLRRDYNKITAAPMNEDDDQENMPAGQEELSPTSISKIVASLVDYSKSLPAVPSSSRPTNGEDGDAGSEQNCESFGDSASYIGETPLRGNSRETSISPNSMEEQVVRDKSSGSEAQNGSNTNWDQLSSNESKSTSPSEDDDVLIIGESGNLSDSSYRPTKRMRRHSSVEGISTIRPMVGRSVVTAIRMKQNQPKTDSGKSILKGILSNEHANNDLSLAPDEDGNYLANEVDDTPRSDGIEVMRASIMDWNGFEENFLGFEEPVPKRIRAHEELDAYGYEDSLSSCSFDYNEFDADDDDVDDNDDDQDNDTPMSLEPDNEESCQIQSEPENSEPVQEETVMPIAVMSGAIVCPEMQIAFRGNYGQIYQLLPCSEEGRLSSSQQEQPIPMTSEVYPEEIIVNMDEDPCIQEAEIDQEDSGINVFKSNASGKVDVDEEILKVIFEEEDLTQAASMHFKKGTIIMGNGTFSLGTSGTAHEDGGGEGERPAADNMRAWPSKRVKGRSRSNSLETRPKSAMDSQNRPLYPPMPRRNSSSNDGDFKMDSGAEITPSSSMENLFPKSRPVRNRAKVHSADFIYDLSDEVVSEVILTTSKSHQARTDAQGEPTDRNIIAAADINPQVMLVRTEDMQLPRLARIKSDSVSELPLDETMNNNSTGCSIVNVIRKSVRAQVTKL